MLKGANSKGIFGAIGANSDPWTTEQQITSFTLHFYF